MTPPIPKHWKLYDGDKNWQFVPGAKFWAEGEGWSRLISGGAYAVPGNQMIVPASGLPLLLAKLSRPFFT